ncbi:hypothetical protein [Blastococcus sp. SYSU DS0973]
MRIALKGCPNRPAVGGYDIGFVERSKEAGILVGEVYVMQVHSLDASGDSVITAYKSM